MALALVGLLAIGNILSNRVIPPWFYVPCNLLVALGVVLVARRAVGWTDMGLGSWRRGAIWGGALMGATLAVFLIGTVLPATRDLYQDRRVDAGVAELLYQTLIRIPLGTVLLEEVAFRGALPAVLTRRMTAPRAVVVASVLFGLWHVLPAWGISDVNPFIDRLLGDGWAGQLSGIALAVAGTFLAGIWLCFVRYRADSLLASVLAHIATNSFGYALAWALTR